MNPTITESRVKLAEEIHRIRRVKLSRIDILKTLGMANSAIAKKINLPESSIRSMIKENP